jgi:hypothetical protein
MIKGESKMNKKPLIVVSICAVVLLVMGSLSNVVGYQAVQNSQQNLIKERINQRDLLFQTIVDIANNKEIQRIILKAQMSKGVFPTSEFPVVTKNQLKIMYFLGMILSKVISKSRIQSMIGKYQFNNQDIQKEINAVIEKDKTINSELTKLKDSDCDCDDEKTVGVWKFPVICKGLYLLFLFFFALYFFSRVRIWHEFVILLNGIGTVLGCFWAPYKGMN